MDTVELRNDWSQQTLSRRRLIQGAIAGAVALAAMEGRTAWAGRSVEDLISSVAYQATIQCASIGVLDPHTFNTLVAVGAQIIPSDDDPGATEAQQTLEREYTRLRSFLAPAHTAHLPGSEAESGSERPA